MSELLADHLASLAADRVALSLLDPSRLGQPIPSCPDWDLSGLLGHLGWVHRFATMCAVAALDADLPLPDIHPPTDASLIRWIDEGIAELLAVLEPSDLDRPCPTFVGPSTRRWWLRRQAFETAVHRWDAQAALGTAQPIPDAADGIDEWFEIQPVRGWSPPHELVGTIHLHCTDGPGEWFIELDGSGSMRWEHAHRKGDVAVRGPASDLYLMLWGRVPPTQLDVIGDAQLLDAVLASL